MPPIDNVLRGGPDPPLSTPKVVVLLTLLLANDCLHHIVMMCSDNLRNWLEPSRNPLLSCATSPHDLGNRPINRQAKGGSVAHRRWLLGLLILQSISSVVLDSYQHLIKEHLVVTFFLTMLVRWSNCII